MQTYLSTLSNDIWEAVVNGYTTPSTPLTNPSNKKLFESDYKAKNAIICGMVDSELVKIMGCKFVKEMWDKLKSIHEGDKKIKEANMQSFRAQFEGLKMNYAEYITTYMLGVNEVINSIRGMGEKIEDKVTIKKILRSLTSIFDVKVLSIEEANVMNFFTLD